MKLRRYADGSYARSQASFEPFLLPDPEEQPVIWNNDFSGIGKYSDLDGTLILYSTGLTVGF